MTYRNSLVGVHSIGADSNTAHADARERESRAKAIRKVACELLELAGVMDGKICWSVALGGSKLDEPIALLHWSQGVLREGEVCRALDIDVNAVVSGGIEMSVRPISFSALYPSTLADPMISVKSVLSAEQARGQAFDKFVQAEELDGLQLWNIALAGSKLDEPIGWLLWSRDRPSESIACEVLDIDENAVTHGGIEISIKPMGFAALFPESPTRAELLLHTDQVESQMSEDKKLKPYSVTLPWNPSDSDEGDYATTAWASDSDEALTLAATEMADSRENAFDTEDERRQYIQCLVDDGGYVVEVADEIQDNLGVIFKDQLFPDGVVRDIDLEALGRLLAENRERLVAAPVKRPSPGM